MSSPVLRADGVRCGGVFSVDRTYRYVLTRFWPGGTGVASFVGLNPSTATETEDDPTVRKCMGFARSWACSGMVMLNAFAFRATDPRKMMKAGDPVGPENDAYLRAWLWMPSPFDTAIACWGVHGAHRDRGKHVHQLLREECGDQQQPVEMDAGPRRPHDRLFTFGFTKDGHPKHPLYLAGATPLQRWTTP